MSLPSRRAFLGAVAVVGAGAAGAVTGWSTTRPARRSGPNRPGGGFSPGRANGPGAEPATVLEAAVAREVALLARLDAAVTAAPALRARVDVLRADHRAHLASLQELVRSAGATSPASTSPTSTSPTSTSPTPAAPGVPSTAGIRVWERAAALSAARDSARLNGGSAVVLASISASEATHAAWLA